MSEILENRILREELTEARTVAREMFRWLDLHNAECSSWHNLVDSLPDWVRN